ncbi:hypothetical protein PC116_g30777 [Phytophthora cactorum]|nr:hypothetical protein PC116_g30777 [Phytophthora cactorum]
MLPYLDAGRSVYDIAAPVPDSFPPRQYLEYLNTPAFQKAIGARLNYTETNSQVAAAFVSTGDYEREAMVPKLASLLNAGIRVGLIYGDRDYICNWLGGEAVSLALASSAPGYDVGFTSAEYAPIIVNDSYIGGVVRQFGNLSFSRVYQAGHFVPAYQPATAFEIFARIIRGDSVSTGENIDLSTYNTTGSAEANSALELPAAPSPTCWLRDVPGSCNEEEQSVISKGEAFVVNGIVQIGPTTTAPPASAVVSSSTTTTQLTGLFTATATPSSAAIPRQRPGSDLWLAIGSGTIVAIIIGS